MGGGAPGCIGRGVNAEGRAARWRWFARSCPRFDLSCGRPNRAETSAAFPLALPSPQDHEQERKAGTDARLVERTPARRLDLTQQQQDRRLARRLGVRRRLQARQRRPLGRWGRRLGHSRLSSVTETGLQKGSILGCQILATLPCPRGRVGPLSYTAVTSRRSACSVASWSRPWSRKVCQTRASIRARSARRRGAE